MPRRNFLLLISVSAVSLICYHGMQTDRFGRVWVEAMDQIAERSLKEIGRKELFEGAMAGMVDRLGDPNSSYLPPKPLEHFNEELEKQFAGVGMGVSSSPKTGQLMVTNPVIGRPTPAYEQGIRAGDVILRIDGRSTQGLSPGDAAGYMRGEPDSPVLLSVLHQGQQRPVQIEIVRKIIHVDSVLGDVRDMEDLSWNFFLEGHHRIGYVRITSFATETAEEMRQAMKWLHDRDVQGLILDMRGNPGGLLTAAEKICDMFVDSGVIVTRERRNARITTPATAPGTYLGFPMAVLVDGGSASASEIVAACLQDHKRAVVVGERTYGKGTVQEVIILPDARGALRLTTSRYLRPNKANIHREPGAGEDDVWGVQPDTGYKIVMDKEEHYQRQRWRLRRDVVGLGGSPPEGDDDDTLTLEKDRQLAKAVEYIFNVAEATTKRNGSERSLSF